MYIITYACNGWIWSMPVKWAPEVRCYCVRADNVGPMPMQFWTRFLWLSKYSVNRVIRYICNTSSHWRTPCLVIDRKLALFNQYGIPDSKVHGDNMGPIWVLSAPDGPHVVPMNHAIWDAYFKCDVFPKPNCGRWARQVFPCRQVATKPGSR